MLLNKRYNAFCFAFLRLLVRVITPFDKRYNAFIHVITPFDWRYNAFVSHYNANKGVITRIG
jgi:hypothetical protein